MASYNVLIKGDKVALQFHTSEANADGTSTPRLTCEHVFTREAADKLALKFQTACKTIVDSATDATEGRAMDDADEADLDRI